VANRQDLVAALEKGLSTDDAASWQRRLNAADVPAGQVGDVGSAFALAEELGLAPTVDIGQNHPRQVRHPVQYSTTDPAAPTPPPRLGQHNDLVRRWLSADPAEPLIDPA
jgi:formyl-CoA transferase